MGTSGGLRIKPTANIKFKLCPGDVVLEVFCFLITLVQFATEVLLIGHNINYNRYTQI